MHKTINFEDIAIGQAFIVNVVFEDITSLTIAVRTGYMEAKCLKSDIIFTLNFDYPVLMATKAHIYFFSVQKLFKQIASNFYILHNMIV